ncbi:hypothetical protein Pcinc_014941 [Petrolisthes cinctipes]|uniref:Uncharacterized protein n=1 Tax=Petrolisthes cinctipes TaxID=88211 RepID=A0AAE1KQZ0_PETCI|nr:hypothetical protein Pcinc_014941 [Petrolisthes cinctipes]
MLLQRLAENLESLMAGQGARSAPTLPPRPDIMSISDDSNDDNNVLKQVKKLIRKVNAVDTLIQGELQKVSSEVTFVGETVEGHMTQLHERHERLSAQVEGGDAAVLASLQQATATLEEATANIRSDIQHVAIGGGGCGESGGEVVARLDSLDRLYREQEQELHDLSEHTYKSLEDHLNTLQMLVEESHAEQANINASVAHLTNNLGLLNNTTQESMNHYSNLLKTTIETSATKVDESVATLGSELKEGNVNIMDILDDHGSQAETLQNTVLDNYSELSDEIRSLKRVEQVMINTADSVLDTKRSIEFGIQQIILELGEIVKSSGSTINSTLSDQISNVSFAILKNQTSALTNMTAKMENEISQVWRQIGIMYQQMAQSVDLLDQLKDTTKEHMNASLSRVGNMDGTVGRINTKVADVEDNLNYLLGRLSLVVSEFNIMKSGVGDELMRLRENLAQNGGGTPNTASNQVDFVGEYQPPPEARYNVNRKRHAPPATDPYQGYNPEPLTIF